jgi:hypothetical protein
VVDQRARLATEKAAADDRTSTAHAKLPEIEAEKKAAAARKVGEGHVSGFDDTGSRVA